MKRITLIIITLFAISFSSCDEDILKLATMSAEVDGNSWNTVVRATVLSSENFIITGTSADGTIISITIMGDEEGTYSLSIIPTVTEFAATYNEDVSVQGTFIASAGKVILTKVDKANKEISGEFYFTGNNLTGTVNVANGIFEELNYSEQ